MENISVVLVDDHPVVRRGIRRILEKSKNIQVIGEASTGHEGVVCVSERRPTVALLDIELPDMLGYEVAFHIRRQLPDQKILAISAHNNSHYILKMLASGASGYLLKNEAPRCVATAVRAVAQGERGWLSPKVRQALAENKAGTMFMEAVEVAKEMDRSDTVPALSAQEQQILAWIATGKTNPEIAQVAGLSLQQVDALIKNLMEKIGGSTRMDTAARALFGNLI